MNTKVARRAFVLRAGIVVIAAAAMLAGSYALIRSGVNYAIGGTAAPAEAERPDDGVLRTVVTRVENTAELDPEAAVVSVPLDAKFEVPGKFYGVKARRPIRLGPANTKGMTQDALGSQGGILLSGERLLYPFWKQLAAFPTEAPGEPSVADGTHMSTPSIRMLDLASGEDEVVVSGARSMAWDASGRFAYAAGVDADYRYNMPYLQRVVVQNGTGGAPEVWTRDADRYTVLQWVGDTLLVRKDEVGGEYEILAFAGPGQAKPLLAEGETYLAASPDGSRILVSAGGMDSTDPISLRVVELASGREVSRLSLDGTRDPATDEPILAVAGASWEGDTVVVSLTPADIAVLTAGDDTLALEEVITFKYPKLRPGSIENPVLNAAGTKVFVVTREGTDTTELERTAVVTYDLASGRCTRWITPGGPTVTRLVSNPSRPR